MWGMRLVSGRRGWIWGRPNVICIRHMTLVAGLVGLIAGCGGSRSGVPLRHVTFYQHWQLQAGSTIAGYSVNSGLGDIGIDLKGGRVYAPYAGLVQPHQGGCVVFSTASLPAYLFRLCGLRRVRLGRVQAGETIGMGAVVQVGTLRKQPNGTWAFVEPSAGLLTAMLQRP